MAITEENPSTWLTGARSMAFIFLIFIYLLFVASKMFFIFHLKFTLNVCHII